MRGIAGSVRPDGPTVLTHGPVEITRTRMGDAPSARAESDIPRS